MGVAVEDGGEFGGGGVEVEGLQVVEHIDVAGPSTRTTSVSGSLAQEPLGSTLPRMAVTGAIFFELARMEDLADVAEVQNAIDAFERGSDFGAEQAVGVADDAEFHGFRISGGERRLADQRWTGTC